MKEKMELTNIQVEYAHRIKNKSNKPGPRTIVARLAHDKDKSTAIKNFHRLRGTKIFINEDLSERTLNMRKQKLPELKSARARGKIAYFDKVKLIIRDRKQNLNQQSGSSTTSRHDDDINNSRVSTLVSVFDASPLPAGDSTLIGTNETGIQSPVSSRLRTR